MSQPTPPPVMPAPATPYPIQSARTPIGINPQDVAVNLLNPSTPYIEHDAADAGKSTGQWDHRNLTYSIDTPMDDGTRAALQKSFTMFQTGYSAGLGFTFTQVDASATPDIYISLGSLSGNNLGQTVSTSHSGAQPTLRSGTHIVIEDPALRPLDPATGYYSGTTATQLQAITHELGHALGMGDSTDRWSIMNPNFSALNDLHNGIDNGSTISAETALYVTGSVRNDSLPDVYNYSGNEAAVYRFFDATNGTQFVTSDLNERNGIINSRPDLRYEGLGMGSVKDATQDSNAAPVYRFFDTTFGTHFFTTSASEAATVAATRSDMTQEAASVYEHVTQQAGDVAVYRFFDSKNGTHFYTNSASEHASLMQTRPDMISEGVAFYAPKT